MRRGKTRAPTTTVVTRTATPYDAALCLNSDTFVVASAGRQVSGSSPGGINFTVTFYQSHRPAAAAAAVARLQPCQYVDDRFAAAVVNDAGNPPPHPGGAPMTLTYDEKLATLRHCIELHRPG